MSIGFAQDVSSEVASRSNSASMVTANFADSEAPLMHPQPAEIVKRFIAAEGAFREALRDYSFMREVVLQTIGPEGQITGEYIRTSQFVLDDRGGRVERVLYHPKSTIREMKITREDVQDLAGAQLFGFEFADVSRYRIDYMGPETIASRQTYAIDLAPSQPANAHRMHERFFVGRVWVDAYSFQIVKMRGVAVPQGRQRFPTFETLRAKAGSINTLFPLSTFADELLHFPLSNVHFRITVRYYGYKRFASRVKISEIERP
jgi:hypothetical protein